MSTVSRDLWQNYILNLNYISTEAEFFSINPRINLMLSFTSNVNVGTPDPKDVFISNIMSELRIIDKGRTFVHLGHPLPNVPSLKLSPGATSMVTFSLDLNYYGLGQIERLRENSDLKLSVRCYCIVERIGDANSRRDCMFNPLEFLVSKSDWVEKDLPRLKYKDVTLLEIPKLPNSEFTDIVNYINGAWKQYCMGEYDKVHGECRKALEALGSKVKSKGFEKEIDEKGVKKVIPDWGKLLGSEELGDIVGTINQKIWGFVTPGAHAGKAINREDADFAMMTTHAIVSIAVRKLSST